MQPSNNLHPFMHPLLSPHAAGSTAQVVGGRLVGGIDIVHTHKVRSGQGGSSACLSN